ncbi:MAG: DEAD/DEAH box helicase [Lentisphaeria bacterium]|nr:DEAD/DEAH box helicase [Lentisphaeria bacterium]
MQEFRDLGLNEDLLSAIEKKGFKSPSPVQAAVIPKLLDSQADMIAIAQTGTGKTAAFGLPICQTIGAEGYPQALILAPTRELALQITSELKSFLTNTGLKITTIYGGQPAFEQIKDLKRGKDIVVGTPGRVVDMIKRGKLKTDQLDYVVLDEMDEMMNMGFIEDIQLILDATADDTQRLMFSATLAKNIEKLAREHLDQPEIVKVERSKDTTSLIDHVYYLTDRKHRLETLTRILLMEEDIYGILFCQTKRETEELASALNNQGVSAEFIHGDIAQNSRETILSRFRSKKCRLLVATDVAARGIDIDNLTHVINYSVPDSIEAYTHRCGRTGRKGQTGKAVTILTMREQGRLKRIMKVTGFDIQRKQIPEGKEIANARFEQFKLSFQNIDPTKRSMEIAEDLLNGEDPIGDFAKIIQYFSGNSFDPQSYQVLSSKSKNEKEQEVMIRFAKGSADGYSPKSMITLIEEVTSVKGDKINNLQLRKHFCLFSIPAKKAKEAVHNLNQCDSDVDGDELARIDKDAPVRDKGRSRHRKRDGRGKSGFGRDRDRDRGKNSDRGRGGKKSEKGRGKPRRRNRSKD